MPHPLEPSDPGGDPSAEPEADLGCGGSADRPSRREALRVLLSGAVGVGGILGAWDELSAAPRRDVAVATMEELPPGTVVSGEYAGQPVLVSNDEGEVTVMLALCTHEGCEVEWSAGRRDLVCPCHDARFDLRGAVVSGPPPSPLLVLPSRVAEGTVYVVE